MVAPAHRRVVDGEPEAAPAACTPQRDRCRAMGDDHAVAVYQTDIIQTMSEDSDRASAPGSVVTAPAGHRRRNLIIAAVAVVVLVAAGIITGVVADANARAAAEAAADAQAKADRLQAEKEHDKALEEAKWSLDDGGGPLR